MRSFNESDPTAVALFYLSVVGITMFVTHPLISFLSLVGALGFHFATSRRLRPSDGFFALMLCVMTLVNGLFSHNGTTVLFFINDAPITLEAFLYGLRSAASVTAVIYWFRSFTAIMTSDKLLHIFGRLSPKSALVLSMGLRYVALFMRQYERIKDTQTVLGLYGDKNIVDRIKGETRIFSILVTWALENGIITADSMTARGYGIGRRTSFTVFRFEASDVILTIISLFLGVLTLAAVAFGALDFAFYPSITSPPFEMWAFVGSAAFAMLCIIPSMSEVAVAIKWKYYESKL